MKKRNAGKLCSVLIAAALLSSTMLLSGCEGFQSLLPDSCQGRSEKEEKITLFPLYLSSEQPTVPIYQLEESEEEQSEQETPVLTDAKRLARGISVFSRNKTLNIGTEEAPEEYLEIQMDMQQDPKTAEVFYVACDNVTNDESGIIKETSRYVRTSVTVYAKQTGAEIAGFAKKGTELEITGFDSVDEEGLVHKYQVTIPGTDTKGWVYAKYLVDNAADAEAIYTSVAQIHEDRIFKKMDLHGGLPSSLDWYPFERTTIEGNELCEEAKTMYLCSEAAVNNGSYLRLIKEHGINAVVIDIKDGQLAYESEVAKELSPTSYDTAFTSIEEYQAAVKEFRDAGVYTIGRIVCFNDNYYASDHPETCIDSPESTQAWPSAYNRDAWYYNVALAEEAVELMGFNEIQFDYVRFPENAYSMSEDPETDYKNAYDEEKVEAIQNFCFYATDTIHEAGAYFSVDVFGECADEYISAYGQYWPAISNIVDAISGMPYTDHYGSDVDTWSEPYEIVSNFAQLAAARQTEIDTPAIARTWITGYNTPNWDPTVDYDEDKMTEQINALYDAGLTGGFIPWNGGSNIGKYEEYAGIWDKSYTADPNRVTEETSEEETTEASEEETTEAAPEEAAYEEPAYEEPVYEEPAYEEPVYEEPVYEEPVYEEPVYEEPVYEEPVYEEPAYEEPVGDYEY